MAINVIAVTDFFSPIIHPNIEAMSPTKAVMSPVNANETTKAAQPPQ
jgi:hypothetical protein